ncbi:MAG: DNA-processing protein DprA [Cyclobacteriaceae bacterium]|nr:DNA-processing protein DprA [Cyclobacteriaceae bacterium]
MDHNRLALIALHMVPGIGGGSIKQLISYFGSATEIFKQTKGKLKKVPGIGESAAQAILSNLNIGTAEEVLKIAESRNTRVILYYEPAFPQRLKNLFDAPTILFVKGETDLNAHKIISIVGTRNATPYGIDMTCEMVSGLKEHNAVIVSGLAYGIDIEAHKAALENNLDTIAVMASGVNIIYPAIHRAIAEKIVEKGALVSEYTFGVLPDPSRFPARNRIIAGLSDATIVVEAAKKGGALITANIANSYNRDVFALPGNVINKYSEGCNNLIKSNNAHAITSISDLEYIMQWEKNDVVKNTSIQFDVVDQEERAVIKVLHEAADSIPIDELSWRSQIAINRLASVLLNLEFRGFVISLPGKRYQLAGKLANA